jgi:hypothetical protein
MEMRDFCTIAAYSFRDRQKVNHVCVYVLLGPRAVAHHRYYKDKFEDYPPTRRAVIPFIL